LPGKFLFDLDEVVANQVEDFLDGQKRDGRSSLETRFGQALRRARPCQR
jgi:hypothetical protein